MAERDLLDTRWDDDLADRIADWRGGRADRHDRAELAARLRRDPLAVDQLLASAALEQALCHAPAPRLREPRLRRGPLLAAAAILLLAVAGGWLLLRRGPPPVAIGDGIAVVAGDGSGDGSEFRFRRDGAELVLAGRATLAGRAGTHLRLVALDEGIECALLAGHLVVDADREHGPLRITTPAGAVETLGTRFTVELLEPEPSMTVSPFLVRVLSGAVLVSGIWGQSELRAADGGDAHRFPPADERPEDEPAPETLAELDERIAVDFDGTDILEVLAFFKAEADINLIVQPQVVAGAATPPVVFEADDIEVGRALELIAWQTGLDIDYHNEAWLFTAAADAPTRRVVYPPNSLGLAVEAAGADGDGLAASARQLLKPVIDATPAEVVISAWNGRLMIDAPDRVHRFVEDLRELEHNQAVVVDDDALPVLSTHFPPASPGLEAALARTIAFDFQDLPFVDVVAFLREQADLTIVLHSEVYAEADLPPITLSGEIKIATMLEWIAVQTGLAIFVSGEELIVAPEAPLRIQPLPLSGPESAYDELVTVIGEQLGDEDEPAWAARIGHLVLVEAEHAEEARQLLRALRKDDEADADR